MIDRRDTATTPTNHPSTDSPPTSAEHGKVCPCGHFARSHDESGCRVPTRTRICRCKNNRTIVNAGADHYDMAANRVTRWRTNANVQPTPHARRRTAQTKHAAATTADTAR
jgi:hypothetical protein